jgi:hypothetical protein
MSDYATLLLDQVSLTCRSIDGIFLLLALVLAAAPPFTRDDLQARSKSQTPGSSARPVARENSIITAGTGVAARMLTSPRPPRPSTEIVHLPDRHRRTDRSNPRHRR